MWLGMIALVSALGNMCGEDRSHENSLRLPKKQSISKQSLATSLASLGECGRKAADLARKRNCSSFMDLFSPRTLWISSVTGR